MKAFKAILFIALIVIVGTWVFSDDKPTASDPLNDAQYCTKHHEMYVPGNIYGGCSKCFKEQDLKDKEKSIQKARRL